MSSPAGGSVGGRPGGGPRVSVKMEAAAAPFFHPEEGLELLPGFVQLPGFVEGAPEEEEEDEEEEELVAERKKGPFSAPSMRGPSGVVLQPPLLKLPPATDLEQLLIPSSPTAPSGNAPGGPFLYRAPAPPPSSSSSSAAQVTQEQEGFADGFVKALADLHKQNQLLGVPPPPPPTAPLSPAQPHPCCPPARQPEPPAIYTTLGGYNPGSPAGAGAFYGRPLEEPQTVPETPGVGVSVGPPSVLSSGESPSPPQQHPPPPPSSLSPLDAESQERLKAERKRLRNRIAASKCRRRKLERIARLEEKVKALKGQNAELAATASLLRAQVTQLQGRVRSHLSSGCHINTAAPAPSSSSQTSGVVGIQPPCREGPPEPESSTC